MRPSRSFSSTKQRYNLARATSFSPRRHRPAAARMASIAHDEAAPLARDAEEEGRATGRGAGEGHGADRGEADDADTVPPPYTESDDIHSGLCCYLCDDVDAVKWYKWHTLLEHVRRMHGVAHSKLNGSYLHTMGRAQLAELSKIRYQAKAKGRGGAASRGAAPRATDPCRAEAPVEAEARGSGDDDLERPRHCGWMQMSCWVRCSADGTPVSPLEWSLSPPSAQAGAANAVSGEEMAGEITTREKKPTRDGRDACDGKKTNIKAGTEGVVGDEKKAASPRVPSLHALPTFLLGKGAVGGKRAMEDGELNQQAKKACRVISLPCTFRPRYYMTPDERKWATDAHDELMQTTGAKCDLPFCERLYQWGVFQSKLSESASPAGLKSLFKRHSGGRATAEAPAPVPPRGEGREIAEGATRGDGGDAARAHDEGARGDEEADVCDDGAGELGAIMADIENATSTEEVAHIIEGAQLASVVNSSMTETYEPRTGDGLDERAEGAHEDEEACACEDGSDEMGAIMDGIESASSSVEIAHLVISAHSASARGSDDQAP
jgi:hypothetical protein